MILAGDEMGRTQSGNNNAYCQDNEISWMDWRLLEKNAGLFRFFKLLMHFRRKRSRLRGRKFLENGSSTYARISWHGVRLNEPDLSWESRALALQWHGTAQASDLYLIFNSYWEPLEFALPSLEHKRVWWRFVDTSLNSPEDILEEGKELRLPSQAKYLVAPRSTVVLMGK